MTMQPTSPSESFLIRFKQLTQEHFEEPPGVPSLPESESFKIENVENIFLETCIYFDLNAIFLGTYKQKRVIIKFLDSGMNHEQEIEIMKFLQDHLATPKLIHDQPCNVICRNPIQSDGVFNHMIDGVY